MQLEFYGAASCVTGSCHILRIQNKTVLLDCGLFQGKDEKERGNNYFIFNPEDIDYIILSHAHIDHSGRIPLMYKMGFRGDVICTEGTMDLCDVMLKDSGYIQQMEVEWRNRKRVRQGLEPIEPLYTTQDAEASMNLFRGYSYDKFIELFEGLKIRFKDAGHLLGSSIIEIFIKDKDDDEETKLVYTGDLGNINVPLLKDPTYIEYADYIIMETTYGNRYHGNITNQLNELIKIIEETTKRGGNVIIPSFAVGRTQEVLYILNEYAENNILKDITVYVDSPLATEATKIFEKYKNYYDDDAKKLLQKGDNPLNFKGLVFTKSVQDSMMVNKIQSGAVIISSSGMCEAGRIRHHLKHNLWRKECSIVFVGYQAEGTLGYSILNGKKKVKLFGEEVTVNAKIYNLEGLSGHADRAGLLNWIKKLKKKPREILLVHGNEDSEEGFKKLLNAKDYKARIMELGQIYKINQMESINKLSMKERLIKLIDYYDNIENIDKNMLLTKIDNILNSTEE
ncbi:MBL fold metallo-hydrolase RNA specificity domain-containing protein [Haloimpatiens sp. FM7330]|uniref:MBL fold metallo-hydrolase RNA specificity domain-containing protein n=1 Tax=Haloimpatiens sp. FM7330 TaxID=3298610 RepID=UPI003637B678